MTRVCVCKLTRRYPHKLTRIFRLSHTQTTPIALRSVCATEQVPVSWLRLPFPCCNTIPALLCAPLCALHVVWFHCVCVCVSESTYRWVSAGIYRPYRCVFSTVWSRRRPTMARWQTHRVEVKGLCSSSSILSYHNRYSSPPSCYLHPSGTAPIGGCQLKPPESQKQTLVVGELTLQTINVHFSRAQSQREWDHLGAKIFANSIWQHHQGPLEDMQIRQITVLQQPDDKNIIVIVLCVLVHNEDGDGSVFTQPRINVGNVQRVSAKPLMCRNFMFFLSDQFSVLYCDNIEL